MTVEIDGVAVGELEFFAGVVDWEGEYIEGVS